MKISQKGKNIEFLIALLFLLVGASFRILPHIPNFSPVVAIALFGAVYFSKRIALVLPIAVMLASDVFIGFYDLKLMAAVYGSFILCVLIGFWLKKNKKWPTILFSSVISSCLFFIITNFAVWAFTPWYDKSFPGIIQCYAMALPFFKNTLLGDLFYVSAFFGIFELARAWIAKKFKLQKPTWENLASV